MSVSESENPAIPSPTPDGAPPADEPATGGRTSST